jgi:succinate dehydrogenase / fumarate reductase flavoprotein subunit
VEEANPAVQEALTQVKTKIDKLLSIKGKRTVDSFHRELGKIVWDYCGMARTAEGLEKAIGLIRALREEYWKNVTVAGSADDLNESLEKAGRVADFFELAELMCIDARAAATSARSTRPPRARLNATTSTTPTSRPGATRATTLRPS